MNQSWKTNYVRYRTIFHNFVGNYREREDIKVYLELFLSLGTVVIFAVFALRPTLLTISTLIKEIEAKKQIIQQMDDKIADLIEAQRVYDQNRQSITLLFQAVPENADPEVILRQIEGGVAESQVGVRNLTMNEMRVLSSSTGMDEKASSENEEVTFSISTTSDYPNLTRFVNILEELRKPVKINLTSFNYALEEETNQLIMTVEAALPVVKQK